LTADSLLPRTAAARGVEPKPAVDAQLISDLLGETRRHALVSRKEHWLRLDLEAIERAFGRQILDERVRSSVATSRERALRLAEAVGRPSETIAYGFAADLFVSLAVERPWDRRGAHRLVSALTDVLRIDADEIGVHLLIASLAAPQLLELPPMVALDVQLSMLVALSPATAASIWIRDESGRPDCILTFGEAAASRRCRAAAARALEGGDIEGGDRALIAAIAIRRWQTPWGALVVRARSREVLSAVLEEASAAMGPIVEREFLLRRGAEREQELVKASERRLSRLGFDLHDGALQHIAALNADVRRMKPHLGDEAGPELDGIEQRLAELDRVLRELAHSLEPASLLRRPLERVINAEAAALEERTGIDVRARVVGDFGAMTQSQKIALIRVVQEAFTNIREHSNATTVDVALTASRSCVELQIVDDGDGFEVTRTLQHAAQRGRLGLVGSSERLRLLGGTFDIRSKAGGPTSIAVTLPRWQPLADQSALEAAY
jgi:signal transduction histidine kinase